MVGDEPYEAPEGSEGPIEQGTRGGSDDPTPKVLFRGSQSHMKSFGKYFLRVLWIVLFTAGGVYVPALVSDNLVELSKEVQGYVRLGFFVLAAFGLFSAFILWLKVRSIRYRVTDTRIEITKGIFSKSDDNTEIFRIKDMRLKRSFLERIVGIGSIEILSSDESHPEQEIAGIRGAKKLYEDLKSAVDVSRRRRRVHEW